MLNLQDNEMIHQLINSKTKDECIIPIGIKIYQDYFMLIELDDIDKCDFSNIKIVYGGLQSPIERSQFPNVYALQYPIIHVSIVTDENTGVSTKYMCMEVSRINHPQNKDEESMNQYFDLIVNKLKVQVNEARTRRIQNMFESQET